MKRAVVTSALLIACTGLYAQTGTEIRVHRPVFAPALLQANTTQQVGLSTFINHGDARVISVRAYAHDAKGLPTTLSGTHNDDGRNGDLYAGDRRFSLLLTLPEREPVLRTYSIEAEIERLRDPIWSTAVTLEALPEEAPFGSAPPSFERGVVDPTSEAILACDGVLVYFTKGIELTTTAPLQS